MSQTTPLLRSGDRLTRVEFERRYSAMPDTTAELIDGVVYVASPVSRRHGRLSIALNAWIFAFSRRRPDLEAIEDATVRLDEDNEAQPDGCLVRKDHPEEDGYLKGPPLLVVEAAYSSAAYDLHQKKDMYRRHGCKEYLVAVEHSREIFWFQNVDGRFVAIEPTRPGIYESKLFPGLSLDAEALFAGDADRLLSNLEDALKKLGN